MTPISKVLSLLLTVLIVSSLFVPAVAATADDGKKTITPEKALEFRIEHGYLTQFTGDGVGYWYHGGDVWDIYINKTKSFTFNADNDEKRMKLLEFMQMVDEQHVRVTMGVGALMIIGGFLFVAAAAMAPVMIVPAAVLGAASTGFVVCAVRADSGCGILAYKLHSMEWK